MTKYILEFDADSGVTEKQLEQAEMEFLQFLDSPKQVCALGPGVSLKVITYEPTQLSHVVAEKKS
jgi:hypothetical protein